MGLSKVHSGYICDSDVSASAAWRYIPSTSTESSCGGSHETCIELAVQLTTRTLEGVVGVDAVCTVMLSDLDDMMNVLLQCSFAVTQHVHQLCQILSTLITSSSSITSTHL